MTIRDRREEATGIQDIHPITRFPSIIVIERQSIILTTLTWTSQRGSGSNEARNFVKSCHFFQRPESDRRGASAGMAVGMAANGPPKPAISCHARSTLF